MDEALVWGVVVIANLLWSLVWSMIFVTEASKGIPRKVRGLC